jgi:transposase-like protein
MTEQRTTARELTERQRFWLEHLRRAAESGATLSGYAKEHGLSRAALYSQRRVFKARGLVPEGRGRTVPTRLARVVVESAPPAVCRVRLPNGCIVEWQGAPDQQLLGAWLRAVNALS